MSLWIKHEVSSDWDHSHPQQQIQRHFKIFRDWRLYLGKQFLLLSEELFLWDAQVLQPRAGLPPFQSYSFTLLQDIFYLCDVWCETETLKGCGVKTRLKRHCYHKLFETLGVEMTHPQLYFPTVADSPLMTCSGDIVFLSDLLHISLASDDIRWMNSVQQLTTSSLASLATRTLGRVSLIILLIAALGIVRSSSFPEEEAIVAGKCSQTR